MSQKSIPEGDLAAAVRELTREVRALRGDVSTKLGLIAFQVEQSRGGGAKWKDSSRHVYHRAYGPFMPRDLKWYFVETREQPNNDRAKTILLKVPGFWKMPSTNGEKKPQGLLVREDILARFEIKLPLDYVQFLPHADGSLEVFPREDSE